MLLSGGAVRMELCPMLGCAALNFCYNFSSAAAPFRGSFLF